MPTLPFVDSTVFHPVTIRVTIGLLEKRNIVVVDDIMLFMLQLTAIMIPQFKKQMKSL